MMNKTNPTGSQLASTSQSKPLGQQQQVVNISVPSSVSTRRRLVPNRPNNDLIAEHSSENYLKICVPLYEASIRSDWKAAKAILETAPNLVRYSLTENGDTALHIAVSVKRSSKHVVKFVENLVDMMETRDLELQNENFNTGLCLAAATGNIKTIKILVKKNKTLTTIPGGGGGMPLYVAASFGNYDVVKYLYEHSNDLCDDGWYDESRRRLLEKCVEADMFDVAIKIVEKYPELITGDVLGILARKPDAFSVTKTNITKIMRSIHTVVALIGLREEANENESKALQMLKIIWKDIAKKSRDEIDMMLKGSPDMIKKREKLASEKLVQALQLQTLISKHLETLAKETENIKEAYGNHDQAPQLEKLISQHLVKMHVETQNLIKQDNKSISNKRDQAVELQNLISEHIVNMHNETQNITKRAYQKEEQAQHLQTLISNSIFKMRTASILKQQHSSGVLFVAAEKGNTIFLVELIRRYPDLIRKVDDNGQSIFHIAVKHRHEGIYNLLYEIGSMKDWVVSLKDAEDNNMLHLAGKNAKKERLADVSGAALQMQRELLWFREVSNMIPPSLREQRNRDGLTPRELFTEEHKELIREGEKWMKGAASQCMVVATLIATIVFAAAFTIPGGYNQNSGIPMFYRQPIFVVFVVADAISLFLSSASILTFLSILTSRYAERDFVKSLPGKLMLGISTLFLSIIAMMITFSVSFFILYNKQMQWIPIFISVFASMPVLLYVLLQRHLLFDVVRSTNGSRCLFKPEKQLLYYVNYRV